MQKNEAQDTTPSLKTKI